jgi:hypothetical protein
MENIIDDGLSNSDISYESSIDEKEYRASNYGIKKKRFINQKIKI